jgi:hypothetical protein
MPNLVRIGKRAFNLDNVSTVDLDYHSPALGAGVLVAFIVPSGEGFVERNGDREVGGPIGPDEMVFYGKEAEALRLFLREASVDVLRAAEQIPDIVKKEHRRTT